MPLCNAVIDCALKGACCAVLSESLKGLADKTAPDETVPEVDPDIVEAIGLDKIWVITR